jgi:glycosyltransferase involved in cell wall biosynthesis
MNLSPESGEVASAACAPLPTVLHLLIGAERGGCERDSYFLCKYLGKARHAVLVLGKRGPMSAEWEAIQASVEHLDLLHLPRRRREKLIRGAVTRISPSGIILWHGMAELPFLLHVLPRECGPILIHGGNPADTLSSYNDWRYLLAEQWWPHPHDPIYVCCSQHVANSFETSRYLRKFRRCVITNGVEHSSKEALCVPRFLSPHTDEVIIGMLARLDSIKDHVTLLRALRQVIQTAPHARLELAGDGDRAPALRALTSELGLDGHVRFLGTVEDVYRTLSRWDVFAYAATLAEGFGNALAEALMCGLPAVVSDLPPLHEVCGEDRTVVYVPPGDFAAMAEGLIELIPNLERRKQLSGAARRRALDYLGADVYARHYAELLEAERRRLP